MSLRVFLSVTHLLGVGHLARMVALGHGLLAAGHRVRLVSGGRPVPTIAIDDLDFVQLPPVHCLDADFSRLIGDDDLPVDEAFCTARARQLVDAFEAFEPDVVVTETYPFGRRRLAAEFLGLLEAADKTPNRPAILASVRDILNPPSKPERAVAADRIVADLYDGILVHGDEAATPLGLSWPLGDNTRRRLVYTGYVSAANAQSANARANGAPADRLTARGGGIVVSGGGGVAGLRLFQTAVEAARLDPARRAWRILVGHGVSQADYLRLVAHAGPRLVVERARHDFRMLLTRADVSVSQAGYNTVLDLGLTDVPAVLVPFEDGLEAEQRLRAEGMHREGWATLLRARDLAPDALLRAIEHETTRVRPPGRILHRDGVTASVEAIEAAAREARKTTTAWARLETTLDGLAASSRRAVFWWRDDDACAPSPALDRLLDLAWRVGVPLGLAVIPMLATDALAARLREERGLSILMHGIRHENRAPAGQKKRELGDQSPADLEHALMNGWASLRARFGDRALPILVPPWNRIDRDLVPALSALGFTGLSTFGARTAPRQHGLAVVNTHCDPVFWKAGGGLAPEAELLERLCADLERHEPIGLLTHHLVHDERIWRFVERLLRLAGNHPAVRFASPETLFAAPRTEAFAGADAGL